MRIEINIDKINLTCIEVVDAIKRSRLNANDNTAFLAYETGIIHDINGNNIGSWKTKRSL